jgi:hypothetical protein
MAAIFTLELHWPAVTARHITRADTAAEFLVTFSLSTFQNLTTLLLLVPLGSMQLLRALILSGTS